MRWPVLPRRPALFAERDVSMASAFLAALAEGRRLRGAAAACGMNPGQGIAFLALLHGALGAELAALGAGGITVAETGDDLALTDTAQGDVMTVVSRLYPAP